MSQRKELFIKEFKELCEKHGLTIVATYELEPSAHDPLAVVTLNGFWREQWERILTGKRR
jgi:hypothetical protein